MINRYISRFPKMMGAAISLVMLASCSTQKSNLSYFRDITAETQTVPLPNNDLQKISVDDELFISVNSTDPEVSAQFNLPSTNPASTSKLLAYESPRQLTYIVDTNGNIDFPQLGSIHVAGLTTEELEASLKSQLSKLVDDPIVTARLVNYRINVLGEVSKPGAISVSKKRYTILDALANAGDLTVYGVRDEVLLIREENGMQKRVLLDLTNSNILTSEYFYLQPNDCIYVRPNNVREGNSRYDSYKSYKLSTVSTIVSACSVVASLIIALAIK